ncbi:MAG: SdiA-regulated domain-containing protein, partial [Kangiellaceae bacterium]|nr:SdiA-regulated domain-containing protein [Kangiellaceae bacterium]
MSSTNTIFHLLFRQLAPVCLLSFVLLACGGGEESKTAKLSNSQKTLTIEVEGGGSVGGDVECASQCDSIVDSDTTVTITAQPAQGYVFQQWNGACSGSGSCQVLMNSDKTVAAVFVSESEELDNFLLSISKNGFGAITSSPVGIDCGSDCSEIYLQNTPVTLTATADAANSFTGWSGACGGTGACVVTMTEALSVTANFELQAIPDIFELTVNVNGDGIVTSSPGGINCGNDCTQEYQTGTTVVLTAVASEGFEFVSWGGACSGNDGCNVSMNSLQTVQAEFQAVSLVEHSLNVTTEGNGTVISTPAGINCGVDCEEMYAENSEITLTATADTGFSFVGWSGACSGTSSCLLTMNEAKVVTAIFIEETANEFLLTVSLEGSGTVSSSPSGINCGADCSEVYSENAQVVLTANSSTGFTFQNWAGDCTGSVECVITMDSTKSVIAVFLEDVQDEYELSIVVTGSGRVTSQPVGIDCENDCNELFETDTVVSLTATPDPGFVLNHWQGGCSGNGSCSVTMDENMTVTAVFRDEDSSGILIENYVQQGDAFQVGQIPENASGITWHPGLQQYLVVQNGAARIHRFDENFAHMGSFRISGINTDTEGVAFVGDNEMMVVSENNSASRVTVDEFNGDISGTPPTSQQYQVLTEAGGNQGLEGVAVRKANGVTPARVYACKEGGNGRDYKVVYFDMPEDISSGYN